MSLQNIEQHLQKTIFPELEKGRPDFDRPHTESVVQKVKDILDNTPDLDVDRKVVVIAAYGHDWGYAGLFEGGKPIKDLDKVIDAKKQHMVIGAEKMENLLKDNVFDELSEAQKERILHLIKVHDKLDQLEDPDELVLMEADTMGALDTDYVEPTFDEKSSRKYIKSVRKRRIPNFLTEYSKQRVEELIDKHRKYYEK